MVARKADEAEAQEAESAETIGDRLKRARESQDLSLDAVEAELRISAECLAALEQNRFDVIGAPVFTRGYLKQYGARLGLDVPEILAEYDRTVGETSMQIRPSADPALHDQSRALVWVAAGVIFGIVVVLIWWFTLGPGSNLGA